MGRVTWNCVVIIGACVATLWPTHLRAQIGFESLLASIDRLSVYATCWRPRGTVAPDRGCSPVGGGFGVEVTFGERYVALGKKNPPAGADTVATEIERHCESDGRNCETTTRLAIRPRTTRPAYGLAFALSLGYGQYSAFQSVSSAYELRAMVREVPTAAVHMTWLHPKLTGLLNRVGFYPYLGVRSGLLALSNASAYVKDTSAVTTINYTTSANAFQVGGHVGVRVGLADGPQLFMQMSRDHRLFPSVQWATAGSGRVPQILPKELNFTGATLTVGVGTTVRRP
jgi:hypothetical protein